MKKIILIIISLFTMCNYIDAYAEYKIGDEVNYNNIDFYVIEDSSKDKDSVKLLKTYALKLSDVENFNLDGIDVRENRGYLTTQYGENNNYSESKVKKIIDYWKNSIFNDKYVKEARLISFSELYDDLGYSHATMFSTVLRVDTQYTPSWIYDVNYWYWTMVEVNDSTNEIYSICNMREGALGALIDTEVSEYNSVRPVIELYKSALEEDMSEDEKSSTDILDSNNGDNTQTIKNESKIDEKQDSGFVNDTLNTEIKEEKMNVKKIPDTKANISTIFIMIGILVSSISIIIVIFSVNRLDIKI